MIKTYEMSYVRTLRNITKNLDNGLRCKHASMLVNKKKIIGMGINKPKSDPLQKEYTRLPNMSFIHAEIDCLKGIDIEFTTKATLFVIRTDEKGNYMESCPCTGCSRLIKDLKIPRIIHSTNEGTLKEIILEY